MAVENRADNDPIKIFHKIERWITSCEGVKGYGISLGSMENGVYFRKEKKGMCLLQKD
jgi:hypothetical protein